MLVGPSRAGKSSLINKLIGKNDAKEGEEDEVESTTAEISNYEGRINCIDTIGLGDTKCIYTD